jgi:NADPH:quinone reductase-like Zn-dependent oxidoreductase
MTLVSKVFTTLLTLVAVGLLSLAFALSHNSDCGPAPVPPAGADTMKAVVHRCYGPAEVLTVEDMGKPSPADDEVLIKVHAAAINPVDWHYMTGTPYIMRMDGGFGRPKNTRLGVDFAGTVEAAGSKVKRFKPGDEVFGARNGALAEYVTVREHRSLALKPPELPFEEASAIPVAAITALQGLRDKGRIKPGQKVLINGASGGVGTFAVQIAKSFDTHVTGVCSTRNVELVRSLGADRVIDYTQEDFTKRDGRYDLILDNVGNHSFSEFRRILNPDGVYVMVGGPKTGKWLGPLTRALRAPIYSAIVDQEFRFFVSELNPEDLVVLRDLVQSGKVTPIIDRRYTLSQIGEAMQYLETGRARAKIVITLVRAADAPHRRSAQ